MRDFVQANDFFASLKSTERVYLLVRHAERPHITAADADYGAHVGLTAAGRERAVALGKMFPPEGDAAPVPIYSHRYPEFPPCDRSYRRAFVFLTRQGCKNAF